VLRMMSTIMQSVTTSKNLSMGCWIQMTKAIARMTATYARNFDSLPPRSETVKVMAFAERMMSEEGYGWTAGCVKSG
jgi:hypothetical protein